MASCSVFVRILALSSYYTIVATLEYYLCLSTEYKYRWLGWSISSGHVLDLLYVMKGFFNCTLTPAGLARRARISINNWLQVNTLRKILHILIFSVLCLLAIIEA
jgi:hypothetical protein